MSRRSGRTLLDRRCEEWDIEIPSFQPIDDNVIVWRLPPLKQSAGGLIIPDTADMPNVKGLLLKMGPRAMDILRSNGIEEGHVVIFARFAGWETQDQTPEHRRHNVILMIKARDIIGSDDLLEEIESGRAKYVLSNGRYCLERKLLNGKKEKLLALAAGTSNPNEADTAKKIASRM
jgi:co-chaperonin GroES (HSP10)